MSSTARLLTGYTTHKNTLDIVGVIRAKTAHLLMLDDNSQPEVCMDIYHLIRQVDRNENDSLRRMMCPRKQELKDSMQILADYLRVKVRGLGREINGFDDYRPTV